MLQIRELSLSEVLPLRALVLRNGKLAPEQCVNEGDDHPDTFHTGCVEEQQVVAIATFMQENYPGYEGIGFRLRGMAVALELQGKGYGKKALQFGIQQLNSKGIYYLWCNARKVAYDFYIGQGFQFISEEFEIGDIGPHKVMILKLHSNSEK